MKSLRVSFVICSLALVFPALAAAEGSTLAPGKALFEKHGCTNCHGPDGIHPTSKYAPVLQGKPADYLYRNAVSIFGGDHRSEKTLFMHDQFCVGQEPEEGCYPLPPQQDLRIIADWLGGKGQLPTKKTTPQALYLTSTEAYEKLNALGGKVLFVDVRTRAEVAFVGMPTAVDANAPYMMTGFDEWDVQKKTFKMVPNSGFVLRMNELVQNKGLGKDDSIILICRSGSRSAKAAKLLDAAGYTTVYSVVDGFEGDKAKGGPRKGERVVNGWRNAGLPWSYKLEQGQMYFDL